jgi:ABC-type branched-subunit amino acid transport system substrate-binding protein
MQCRANRVKLISAIVLLCLFGWALSEDPVAAQQSGALSPQEERGKQIYLKGESDGGEIRAILASSDIDLPATSFTCANCHGLRGEGSKEGGLQPPPLNWETLTTKHVSALTRAERVPYNEVTLARAITSGVDSSGNKLHPGMPHYKMTGGQVADLIAYLKKIGKESNADPGLGEGKVRVGATLPMTGPLATIGEDIKAALAAYFAEVNSQGGIYGRKLELVVEDSRGEAAENAHATRRLVEQHKVFSLVASFEPASGDTTNEFLRRSEVPLVGPVTLSARLPAIPNKFVFYLLPSFADQARALVDFIESKRAQNKQRAGLKIVVVHAGGELDQDALAGLKSQIKLHPIEIVAEHEYERGQLSQASTVKSLAAKKPDYIFFFGGGGDLLAFAREMERVKLDAGLLSSAVMAGREAFALPESVSSRTYLSYSTSLPDPNNFAEFVTVMQRAGVTLRNVAFQSIAYAAAKVFVEGIKSSGRELSRASLVASLERLQDFNTGVAPPVTFGPNRRVGAAGSYIVGIDSARKQYIPLSNWIAPKDDSADMKK